MLSGRRFALKAVLLYIGFMSSQPKKHPSDRIWAILEEFSAGQKELQASQKELQASQKKTDLQIKELEARQRKTDLQIQKQGSQFNERWGRMVESLVSGKCVQLLRERGIEVKRIYPNVIGALEENGEAVKNREFDIIAASGKEAVVFEVKTILSVKSVNDFLSVMPDFSKYIPDHRDKTLYAGMACLKANEHAAALAEDRGLFVIRATGDSASLVNKKGFKPKVFSS